MSSKKEASAPQTDKEKLRLGHQRNRWTAGKIEDAPHSGVELTRKCAAVDYL
jgi:hypothetical protein